MALFVAEQHNLQMRIYSLLKTYFAYFDGRDDLDEVIQPGSCQKDREDSTQSELEGSSSLHLENTKILYCVQLVGLLD